MLINGLSNSYRSAAYREAAKWGNTPEIQKKAQTNAEKAMTDSFIEQTKMLAKQDAKKGIYMDKQFVQLRRSQMEQYVSPDRASPMGQVSNLIQEAMNSYDPILSLLDTMLGNCSAEIQVSSVAQNAHIYSPDGEMIASYNSLGGGWTIVPTEAEEKFMSEATAVYAQAYKEARAEMKAAEQAQVSASATVTEGRFSVTV